MSDLYDPDDPTVYSGLQRRVAEISTPAALSRGMRLGVSFDDARKVVEDEIGHDVSADELHELLDDMGYGELAPDLWVQVLVPVLGTGDVEPLENGGGIVFFDLDEGSFKWFFWPARLDDDDDFAVFDMGFGPGEDLVARYTAAGVDMADVATTVGADPADLVAAGRSPHLLDNIHFLQDLIASKGARKIAGRSLDWGPDELLASFGYALEVVSELAPADVPQVLAGLGVGSSAPDSDGELAQMLAEINERRRQIGMPRLDPAAAGWTDDDIRLEAARLRAGNPPRCVRDQLLSW